MKSEPEVKLTTESRYGKITAIIDAERNLCNKLLDKRKIQIGLSLCNVSEKVVLQKCFRSWLYGHMAKGYTGTDRNKACLKEGHKVGQSGNPPYRCAKKGHNHGSMVCDQYKKAAKQRRRRGSTVSIRY